MELEKNKLDEVVKTYKKNSISKLNFNGLASNVSITNGLKTDRTTKPRLTTAKAKANK